MRPSTAPEAASRQGDLLLRADSPGEPGEGSGSAATSPRVDYVTPRERAEPALAAGNTLQEPYTNAFHSRCPARRSRRLSPCTWPARSRGETPPASHPAPADWRLHNGREQLQGTLVATIHSHSKSREGRALLREGRDCEAFSRPPDAIFRFFVYLLLFSAAYQAVCTRRSIWWPQVGFLNFPVTDFQFLPAMASSFQRVLKVAVS